MTTLPRGYYVYQLLGKYHNGAPFIMIIYRITGRVEAFPICELLQIEPSTYSTRQTGLTRLKAIAKGFRKDKLLKRFDLRLEKLSVPSVLTKEQIMGLLAEELYLEDLIEKKEVIATARSEEHADS